MGISLKETRDLLITKGGYDRSKDDYSSLQSLKILINDLNAQRTKEKTICIGHSDFSINDDLLSLARFNQTADKIKTLTCESVQTKICSCETLAGCDCNSRTLTCEKVVSYQETPICSSRTTASNDSICSSRVGENACSCNGRTGYSSGYSYSYCSCNTRTGYFTCLVCTNNADGKGYSCNTCSCHFVGESEYATGYYSSYYYTDYSCVARTFTDPCVCNSRTKLEPSCDCVNRTTVLPCSCDTRSSALCASRSGCECNTVCDCNTVTIFS